MILSIFHRTLVMMFVVSIIIIIAFWVILKSSEKECELESLKDKKIRKTASELLVECFMLVFKCAILSTIVVGIVYIII